jgi:hypothetical protein
MTSAKIGVGVSGVLQAAKVNAVIQNKRSGWRIMKAQYQKRPGRGRAFRGVAG